MGTAQRHELTDAAWAVVVLLLPVTPIAGADPFGVIRGASRHANACVGGISPAAHWSAAGWADFAAARVSFDLPVRNHPKPLTSLLEEYAVGASGILEDAIKPSNACSCPQLE